MNMTSTCFINLMINDVSIGEIRKHSKQIAIEINHISNERSRAAL